MADGDILPDDHHVARYCKQTQTSNGVALGAAFQLEGTHLELSVNWLESLHAEPDRRAQLRAAHAAMSNCLNLKNSGWLAILSVHHIHAPISVGAGTLMKLVVRHHPEPENSAHAGIHGLPAVGDALAAAVALALANRVTEPAVQIKTLLAEESES
jgi:hypothetical protein